MSQRYRNTLLSPLPDAALCWEQNLIKLAKVASKPKQEEQEVDDGPCQKH